jgi:hypothetical protein
MIGYQGWSRVPFYNTKRNETKRKLLLVGSLVARGSTPKVREHARSSVGCVCVCEHMVRVLVGAVLVAQSDRGFFRCWVQCRVGPAGTAGTARFPPPGPVVVGAYTSALLTDQPVGHSQDLPIRRVCGY